MASHIVLVSSQRWRRQTQTVKSYATTKQVLINHHWAANLRFVLCYQLCAVLKPKATHTRSDSHKGQTKNVYHLMKSKFPSTHFKKYFKSLHLVELLFGLQFNQVKWQLKTFLPDLELENTKYWVLLDPYFELNTSRKTASLVYSAKSIDVHIVYDIRIYVYGVQPGCSWS